MALEAPPRRALGDLAVPVAFALARRLKKAPRVIAQELAAALGTIDGVARIEAAPNGYLNFFLDRPLWLRRWAARPALRHRRRAADGKTIVEHTAINPNKAAHIGHLRNAALGDAFGRLLRFQGRQVEIQNYIDDTGVQVADVVVGFRELEHRGAGRGPCARRDSTRFDYYCWDLYAQGHRVVRAGQEPPEAPDAMPCTRSSAAATRSPRWPPSSPIGSCARHLATMRRMNIALRPPDVGGRHPAAALLGARVRVPEENRRRLPADRRASSRAAGSCGSRTSEGRGGAAEPRPPESRREEQREKVIVRSDGTVTYVGKDMAYQLWKFGLLDLDFHYRLFDRVDGDGTSGRRRRMPSRTLSTFPSSVMRRWSAT